MADGTGFSRVRLGEATAPGRGLRARCRRCGAAEPFDPAHWLALGLDGVLLADLEARLRCVCGARGAALELSGPSAEPPPPRRAIHAWR